MKRRWNDRATDSGPGTCAFGLLLVVMLAVPAAAIADEAYAKQRLKAMSDYLTAQKTLSFEYDSILEVITPDDEKLGLASSGSVALQRPNMIRATRSGGFADVLVNFDGKTLTLLGRNQNNYAQADAPGTVDQLVEEMRTNHKRTLPAADILMEDPYDALMTDVSEVKDIGSGVIGGVECDHFAFRAQEVDWQIWIAQGEQPYACRYVITSKLLSGGPQYSIQVRNWKSGGEVATMDFTFRNTTGAAKVDFQGLEGAGDLPDNFSTGETQ